MEVRDILKESLTRAGLCSRRQAPNDSMVESAYQLLKAIAKKYNNDSFLAFTQTDAKLPSAPLIHVFDKTDTMIGADNYLYDTTEALLNEYPSAEMYDAGSYAMAKDDMSKVYTAEHVAQNTYRWVEHPVDEYDTRTQEIIRYAKARHIRLRDVNKLNTLMTSTGSGVSEINYKLNFQPADNFHRFEMNSPTWTWTPLSEGEFVIEVKPYACNAVSNLKLNYNRRFDFDIDTDLRIPDSYIELLIVSLTYKLALSHPRLDAEQMARLKSEVDDMLSNVAVPRADARMVVRDRYGQRAIDANNVLTGAIFGGY